MNKYELDENKPSSRASRNADLYGKDNIDDYNKIDLSSNVSILKTDSKDIDVDKIREMLDKKYRDNIPQRKSIDIPADVELEEAKVTHDPTKEYDINEILAHAKNAKEVDYDEERLRRLRNTNYTILDNLDIKQKLDEDDEDDEDDLEGTGEKELRTLIDTITELEAKSRQEYEDSLTGDVQLTNEVNVVDETSSDLLNLTDENDVEPLPPSDAKEEILPDITMENSFYTGNLAVSPRDYDDFDELEEDIKSNSLLIKILIFVVVIIVFAAIVYFLNQHFEWGLF
jgi:hypothetical protein